MDDPMHGTESAEHGSKAPRSSPPHLQLLIVEDDTQAAETLAQLLRMQGYQVRIVTDGPSALRELEGHLPDVVLLDLGLPGIDGYEVARRLREQTNSKRPTVIAITGYGSDAERVRSYESGIDLHLTKPVSLTELTRFLAAIQSAGVAKP